MQVKHIKLTLNATTCSNSQDEHKQDPYEQWGKINENQMHNGEQWMYARDDNTSKVTRHESSTLASWQNQ